MHFYPHNIGDYRKDTSHLTLLEHGIYRQLLDSYYLDEQPLSNDLAKLMRSHSVRNADEQQSLQNVLTDFFELTEEGYIHKRCDEVIAAYHGKSESARQSANARWARNQSERNANALQTQSEGNANHKPITNNHKPIKDITPIGVSDSVFKDYMEVRKSKKARWTPTALKGMEREAAKAGLTLEQVMIICCERNWQSFNSEWILKDKDIKQRVTSFKEQDAAQAASQLQAMMLGTSLPKERSEACIFDIEVHDAKRIS